MEGNNESSKDKNMDTNKDIVQDINKEILEKLSELESKLSTLEAKSEKLAGELEDIKKGSASSKQSSSVVSEGQDGLTAAQRQYVQPHTPADQRRQALQMRQTAGRQQALQRQQVLKSKQLADKQQRNAEKKSNLEGFIGKNAMGIGASILVFIAMVMFATLLLPYIGEELKCASLYLFSFILIGFGEWVYRRQRNSYLILSACGVGALFISIVATRVYFRFTGSIAMYIMLLLWMVLTTYLGKKRNLLFVIIGQIGISIAMILAGIGASIPTDFYLTFGFLTISELLYFILFFKSEFKFNLTNAIGFAVASLCFVASSGKEVRGFMNPAGASSIAIYLILLVLMCAAMCRLIISTSGKEYVEADNVYDGRLLENESPERRASVAAVVAIVSGMGAYVITHYIRLQLLRLGSLSVSPNMLITADAGWGYAPLTIYLAAILISIALRQRKGDVKLIAPLYLCYVFALLSILMLPHTAYILAIVLAMLVAYNYNENDTHIYYASQIAVGFAIFVTLASQNAYAAIFMLIMTIVQMVYYKDDNPGNRNMTYEIASYLTANFLMMSAVAATVSNVNLRGNISDFALMLAIVLLFVIMQIVAKYVSWMNCREDKLGVYQFANLVMMLFAIRGFFADYSNLQVAVYSIVNAVLYSVNLKQLTDIKTRLGAYIGAKYTLLAILIMAALGAQNFIYSIVFLIIAVTCIVIGFRIDNKSMRMYGLVLSMLSIFKLITIDISYSNTLMRAVSFLVSGLICFGISLVYNRIDKQRQEAEGSS